MPLIIGGGPAGAAAAIRLARSGARPIVLERHGGDHDALCGGFLSWNTLDHIRALGIDPAILGGHVVGQVRLFAGTRTAAFALPAPGMGLSRRTLDRALLAEAQRAGANVRRGIIVRGIEGDTVRLDDGSAMTAEHVLLATGKHDLRGAVRPAVDSDPAMGLRWRFRASDRLTQIIGGAVELHLFDHGYAGLVMQEDGHANLCLAIRRSAFVRVGQRPDAVLATLIANQPALRERLADEQIGQVQAIANVPYGWRAGASDANGLYRIGDQAGVIPSLAGEGVGIALASGMAAARAILSGQDAGDFQAELNHRLKRPIGTASKLWQAAERPWIAHAAFPVLQWFPGAVGQAMRLTRV